MRRGDLEGRLNPSYFGGGYQTLVEKLEAIPTIRKMKDLIREGAFGVLPPGNSYVAEGGIRFLRATELQSDNQIDWNACLRAPIEFSRHERARLKVGDVLIAVKGATIASEKSVCTVESLDEPTIVNGSIFRFQPTTETTSGFLRAVLSSSIVKQQMKGSLILNNAVDYLGRTIIDNLLIPLPPLNIQQKLVADLEADREARKRKLAEADALLAGIDGYLLEKLRLSALEEDNRQVFAVRLKQVRNRRIDPPSYRPYFKSGVQITTPLKSLGDIADIDSNPTTPPSNDETLVPYVGLPECDLNEVREVALRPYKEVRGRSVVKPGNILFARIEPSVFNRKYVFADDLKGHKQAYTSTEFYVVRGKEGVVEQGYLYAMFFCSFVFTQVKGKTTGSSGRRRIDPEMFASLQIPLPDMALQKTIAAEITRRRDEARRLKTEAAKEWEAVKGRFERELLG